MGVTCSVCNQPFKTSQGLAGHSRTKHGTSPKAQTTSASSNTTPPSTKKTVYGTQYTEGEIASRVFRLLGQGKEIADIVIKEKIHPDKALELYNKWLELHGWTQWLRNEIDSGTSIAITDVCCSNCGNMWTVKTTVKNILGTIGVISDPTVASWKCRCGNPLVAVKIV